MRELQLMHIRLFRSENKRLNIRLANAVKTFQQQKQEISELQGERDSLRQMVDNAVQHIDGRSETTYLNIIGGLLSLMLGNSPSGRKMSEFANQGRNYQCDACPF